MPTPPPSGPDCTATEDLLAIVRPLFRVKHSCCHSNSSPVPAMPAYPPLTRQQVVDKLDTIPVFHLMNAQSKIFPVPNEQGEVAIRWYVDVDEANSALVAVQSLNPDMQLQLGVTPLGTAFALSMGWAENGSKFPLKLMAPRAVTAALAQELGAEADESALWVLAAIPLVPLHPQQLVTRYGC